MTHGSTSLGRLEPVPLRHHWASEASDFTPWLASAENLELLSQTVGLSLEIEDTEVLVGPFRADILCRDAHTGRPVLVENQLERTDHTHLGQLLTYAAGLDAAAIIWVARNFSEPHRQALDWLNEITGEDFHFFGIEVELWRIGDSAPAPRLNMIAKPNDWQKAIRTVERNSSSERANMYREVWGALIDLLAEEDLPVELPDPTGMNQLRVPLPDGRFVLGYSPKNRKMTAYALVRGDDRPVRYRRLKERTEELRAELGVDWEWEDDEEYGYGTYAFDYDHETLRSVTEGAQLVSRLVRALTDQFGSLASRDRA